VDGAAQNRYQADTLILKPLNNQNPSSNISIKGSVIGGIVNIGGTTSFGGNMMITGGSSSDII